jgi:hypothetical protein
MLRLVSILLTHLDDSDSICRPDFVSSVEGFCNHSTNCRANSVHYYFVNMQAKENF